MTVAGSTGASGAFNVVSEPRATTLGENPAARQADLMIRVAGVS